MSMKMDKTQISPPEYVFVAGRITKLSVLELQAVFDLESVRLFKLASSLIAVKALNPITKKQFDRLGSVRKFGQVIASFSNPHDLSSDLIKARLAGRNVLGISSLTKRFSALSFGKQVKKTGLVRRFVVGNRGQLLTDAQSKGLKKGLELLVYEDQNLLKLVAIEAAQDIDAFRHRDRDLPIADPVRGMLPTKLARTMVNLAQVGPGAKVFDPFCGVAGY